MIVVSNAVMPEEVEEKEDLEEFEEEMREDAAAFGKLVSFKCVTKEGAKEKKDPIGVRIFMEFGTNAAATDAQKKFQGRKIDGRYAQCEYYELGAYKKADYWRNFKGGY